MSSFSFKLTEKCNWNCKYCDDFGKEDPKETNIEILSKHLPYIKRIINKLGNLVVFCDIGGGEVGLLPIEVLQYFFTELDYPMVIGTNGKFMEMKYHLDPVLRPYIKGLWYHVYPEPKNIKLNIDYHDNDIFINRGIVHDNIDEIIEFIEINAHIKLNYIDFEFPIGEKAEKDDLMYSELYNRIKTFKNVTDDAKELLLKRIDEPSDLRERCMNYNQSFVLDMVNEKILFCHRSHNYINLTEENLIKRLKSFPKDIYGEEKSCDSCTRLYFNKMQGKVFETYFSTKRII